ncbi:hypothetical protein HEQ60_06095 [Haematospirillum sp. H1815]|uniref:hypothetical protein n=1 Tax=Haematospirillum sp. H1815 TaxID=2723108 RepID=UPI001439F778|nr:hypothetical protein [Haematospirillum sp. H1815]NKD77330.1 hypothetical protein [Haematospirillum sp. H1815]
MRRSVDLHYSDKKKNRSEAVGQFSPWNVGDIRWSLKAVTPDWLPADGRIYKRQEWASLADYLAPLELDTSKQAGQLLPTLWQQSNATDIFHEGTIYTIAEGENVLVATGMRYHRGTYQGIIATSPDGIFWTEQPAARDIFGESRVYDLLWAPLPNGRSTFIAGGRDGVLATSPDGVLWTRRDTGLIGVVQGIAFDPDRHILVVLDSLGNASTSQDALHWATPTRCYIGSDSITGNPLAWGYTDTGEGMFVAGDWGGRFAVSHDGITWTTFSNTDAGLDADFQVRSITWGQTGERKGVFLAAGDNGMVAMSTDGRTWSGYNTGLKRAFSTLCVPASQNKNLFLVAGYGPNKLAVSEDGRTWTFVPAFDAAFHSVSVYALACAKGKLLAAGTEATLITLPAFQDTIKRRYDRNKYFSVPSLPVHGLARPYIKAV